MAAPQSNPFVKQLASSDRRIRDRALSSLRTFLQRNTALTPTEAQKLWKGLYYCMWMSDKPRTQQQLARELADLLHNLSPANFLLFADAFWRTMAREWNSIDKLRMDKYLYLVRCYVREGFQYLKSRKWENGLLGEYVKVLEVIALNVRDGKVPNGLRYHVVDLYVDELDQVDEDNAAPLEDLLKPLRRLGKESPVRSLGEHVKSSLDDPRLENWAGRKELACESDDEQDAVNAAQAQHGIVNGGAREDDDFGGFDD